MRRIAFIATAALAGALLAISFIAAAAVGLAGTYLGVKAIIDSDVWQGIVILFLTTPALMLVQTALGLLAAPVGMLAERLERA